MRVLNYVLLISVFLTIMYLLLLSKSLLLFGSLFFLLASFLLMGMFLNSESYKNRIIKVLIFTLYIISATLFYNIDEQDIAIKGLNKSLMSYYFWSIGFLGILTVTLYAKNNEDLNQNKTLKTVFWLVFLSSLIGITYFLTDMILSFKRFKNVKKEAKFVGQTVIKILMFLVFLGLIAINLEGIFKRLKVTKYSFLNLIYVIILYIPCAILDGIRFLNKEFKLSTSDTKLMIMIQVILLTLYFIYPRIIRYILYKDSVELLRHPKYLDTEYEIVSTKHLEKKYHKKFEPTRFFNKVYKGKATLKDFNYLNPFKTLNKKSIRYSKETLDAKKRADLLQKQSDELAWDISFAKIEKTSLSKMDEMKEYLNKLNDKQEYWSKQYYILRTEDTKGEYDKNILVNKNYGLSFWFYVNPVNESYRYSITNYSNIINYGNKLRVEYIGKNENEENVLRFLAKDNASDENELNEIHKENNILLQKWNNIVINYSGSIIDIFLNGILISSVKDIVLDDSYNLIKIGEKNGISGSICNIRFFPDTIKIDKIKGLYKLFKNNDPPSI